MSTHDYDLANAAGASFRADANLALVAQVGRNSSATAPATTFAYMVWVDTASGFVKYRNAANSAWLIGEPIATPSAQQGLAIYGNTYANNGTDPTNDIDIAAGGCADATNTYWMVCGAITKRLDAAWAVGTNQGGLDTGAIGNNDYYIWRIARSDTGVVDALFSLSSTAPTMPSSYDYKRLVGWFKRVGATIVAFHTYETEGGGIEMNWDVPTVDVSLTNTLTTSRRTDAIKVPLNFSVEANINASLIDAGAATVGAWIGCPDQTDAAPTLTAAPILNLYQTVSGAGASANLKVRTSSTGTIAARGGVATVDTYTVSTQGFKWGRRN